MFRPSRTISRTFLIAACCLLPCSRSAHAQPTFVVVDRQPVARGPIFVTSGNFGADGSPGIAVASFWVDEVTVYPATEDGLLGEPTSLSVGRNLRGLLGTDLNGDEAEDLIIADEAGGSREARLFASINAGGELQPPAELPIETSIIQSARAGNFDGVGPSDIATANGRRGTVSIVYARDGVLDPSPNIFLDDVTVDVAAIDLDDDGLDDLAVLTDRGDGLSVVTTLRSEAVGFALLPPATQLNVTGVRMARGDYNGDGVVDLAIVAGGPSNTEYSVRLLLQRRPVPDAGQPRFDVESRSFSCPPDDRGRPSRCTLADMVSADFDRNHADDLAISMPVPGVVAVLPRELVGNFAPPIYLIFGGSPRGLATGDLSGDEVADLAVTEFDQDAVSIAVSVVPPRREAGAPCAAAIECETGACVDSVCCRELQCSLSERCDITGRRGSCSRPLAAGSVCDKDADCRSAMCTAQAPATGVCLPGMNEGACSGDCNQDGEITVDEILVVIQIGLGQANLGVCPSADRSDDGMITVDEIIVAVDLALDGCPPA